MTDDANNETQPAQPEPLLREERSLGSDFVTGVVIGAGGKLGLDAVASIGQVV